MTKIWKDRRGEPLSEQVIRWAEDARKGVMDRREFLALSSAFGATTAMAYGLLGLAAPTKAQAAESRRRAARSASR